MVFAHYIVVFTAAIILLVLSIEIFRKSNNVPATPEVPEIYETQETLETLEIRSQWNPHYTA